MSWTVLGFIVALLVVGAGALLARQRRQSRLTSVGQRLCCPVHECEALVTVRADLGAQTGHRYVDVAACSLLPVTPIAVPATMACSWDVPAAGRYVREVSHAPHHATAVACSKPCLPVLNAAEHWRPVEPLQCASGVADGLELVRQSQGPAMMQLVWFHSN